MKLQEVAKGAWKGKQASQMMHQGNFKQGAQQQQPNQASPQQQQGQADASSGLSAAAQNVINIAKKDPSKIKEIIDFLIGIKNASQHFEKVNNTDMPLLEAASQGKQPRDFLAAWGSAGKPTDISGIKKLLMSLGLDNNQVTQVFKASGINPVDIGTTGDGYELGQRQDEPATKQELNQLQQAVAQVPRNEKKTVVKILKGMMRKGAAR